MNRQDQREMNYIINTIDDIPSPPKNEEEWMIVSKWYVLSEPFMRQFADKLDWYCISNYQTLSEPFIKEFADRLDWPEISEHQNFSIPFILKFKDSLNFQTLQNRIDLPFIVQVQINNKTQKE